MDAGGGHRTGLQLHIQIVGRNILSQVLLGSYGHIHRHTALAVALKSQLLRHRVGKVDLQRNGNILGGLR